MFLYRRLRHKKPKISIIEKSGGFLSDFFYTAKFKLMYKLLFKYQFFLLVFVLSFISCSHKNKSLAKSDTVITEAPKIVFFTFSITKDTLLKTVNIILKNKTVVDGKFKDQEQLSAKNSPNNLKLVFGNGNKTLKEIYVEHPLYKRVDVYGDKGEITSKEINLTTAEFTVRIEQQKGMNKVIVTEFVNFKEIKNTNTLKLD